VTLYTNLFPRPRPSASTSGWASGTGAGGAVTQSTIIDAAGPAGDNARRQTWTASSSNFGASTLAGNAAGIAVASAGSPYSATGWVRVSRAQVMYPRLSFYSDTGYTGALTTVDGAPVSLAANTWTELKIEGQVAPATTAAARVIFQVHSTGTPFLSGDVLDVQAATIIQDVTVPKPFHGSMTSDATHTYAWTGTVDASTSTLLAPTVVLGATAIGTGGAPAGTVVAGATLVGGTATATATAPVGVPTAAVLVLGATATATALAPAPPDWYPTDRWNPADPWPGPHSGTYPATITGVAATATATAAPGVPVYARVVVGVTAQASALAAAGNFVASRLIIGATATATATAPVGAFFAVAAIHTLGLSTLISNGRSLATLTSNGLSVAVLHTTD
jgi:hypothetical protein